MGRGGAKDLVWTGSEFALGWGDDGDNFITRIDESGEAAADTGWIGEPCGDGGLSALAWTGSEFAAAWECFDASWSVAFSRFGSEGHPSGAEAILDDTGRRPDICWTGSVIGMVWSDPVAGGVTPHAPRHVLFARLDLSGAIQGEIVTVASAEGAAQWPSVLWTGSEFAIAWEQSDGVEGRLALALLSPEGTIRSMGEDFTPDPFHHGEPALSLVWTGSELGLTWCELDVSEGLHLTRMGPSGDIAADRLLNLAWEIEEEAMPIAWVGCGFAVAGWEQTSDVMNLYAATLGPSGDEISTGVRVATTPTDPDSRSWADVAGLAWTGSTLGIAWSAHGHGDETRVGFSLVGMCRR